MNSVESELIKGRMEVVVYPNENEDKIEGSMWGDANESGTESHGDPAEQDAMVLSHCDTAALQDCLKAGSRTSASKIQDTKSLDRARFAPRRFGLIRNCVDGNWEQIWL